MTYNVVLTLNFSFQWIFYLEGGGWCWNATSCLNRLVLNGILFGGSSLVSSSHWPPIQTFEDGIFVMEGSGWDEANLVYLPYCSGDAHMGDTQVWSWRQNEFHSSIIVLRR